MRGELPADGMGVNGRLPHQGSPVDAALLARRIRRTVIDLSERAGVGHIGSSLSVADILAALFAGPLTAQLDDSHSRNRFVLSKGHAALALYAVLHAVDRLDTEELATFCQDCSRVGVHPEHVLGGIDFSTGSLGHGLSIGAGAALAARLQEADRQAYVLLSDAECNEGSVWEAAMFAAHHKLANLVAIVDANGQQAFGYTREVLDLEPLAARWTAFGWDVHEVDGNDVAALENTFTSLDLSSGPPHVLIAATTFGKGVTYMEGRIEWHYLPMSGDEYAAAVDELVAEA